MWAAVMVLRKTLTDAEITEQRELIAGVFKMTLHAPEIARTAKPGNFLQVKAAKANTLLRRPLGIADAEGDNISLIYRKIGKGTAELAELQQGDIVSILGALGNSFDESFKNPLLVGGGMGLSPLLFYAQAHKNAAVLMGGRTSSEIFWEDIFKPFAKEIFIATEDGSKGEKGFNVALLPKLLKSGKYDGVIACGPDPMMKKAVDIAREYSVPVEVSLERRMGCGLGACLSCAIDTANGRKKVCKDGPVFKGEEVFF
ncbi:MAG: dihydroorotate dehydrogenase electron transfer subunit [Selenomonadaceae bacterium]|nr:dihydroorotate dehydrogenase electron transfer subunit [Selenomonadaceae bacterium]